MRGDPRELRNDCRGFGAQATATFRAENRFQIGGPAGAFIVLVAATIERHGFDGFLLATFLAGLIRQLPLLAVLVAVAVGLLLVTFEHWRKGLVVVGVALLAAAAIRLLMPLRRVGFLAVRSRSVDVVLMAGAGLLMTVIALAIPGA